MGATEDVTFWEMCRQSPVRTTVASFVPALLAVAQLVNGFVHGVPVAYTVPFAAVMATAALLVTRYHLVVFRRTRLQRDVFGSRDPLDE